MLITIPAGRRVFFLGCDAEIGEGKRRGFKKDLFRQVVLENRLQEFCTAWRIVFQMYLHCIDTNTLTSSSAYVSAASVKERKRDGRFSDQRDFENCFVIQLFIFSPLDFQVSPAAVFRAPSDTFFT